MAAWLDGIFSKKKPSSVRNDRPAGAATPPQGKLPTPQVRTVFMGTPGLAALMLEALVAEKYNIVGVVTKPDLPAGRKKELRASEVKEVAIKHSLPLLQPLRLNEEVVQQISDWKPDLIIVAAYGKILPESILKIPGFGCVNVHASLLPRWRGASPIQNSLLAGDTETGVTLILMDRGMDTGDIISQKKIAIEEHDTQETLSRKIETAGSELLIETLPRWVKRQIIQTPQSEEGATLCQLIEREDGHLIFTESAESLYNRYRALSPWPGIFAFWKKEDGRVRIKLTRVSYGKEPAGEGKKLGEVFENGGKVGIATGDGVLYIHEIQSEGKTAVPIADFVRGNGDFIGALLQ